MDRNEPANGWCWIAFFMQKASYTGTTEVVVAPESIIRAFARPF